MAMEAVDYYYHRNAIVDPSLEISIEDQAPKKLPKLILKKDKVNFAQQSKSKVAPSDQP